MTCDDNGAVTVHNNPVPPKITRTELAPAGKTAAALKKAAAPKRVAAPQPAPPPAAFEPATPQAAPRGKKTAAKKTAKKADPSHVAALLRPTPTPLPPIHKVILPGTGEAEGERLEGNALQLAQFCRNGLPPQYDLAFHGDVLAMQGVDLDAAEAAVRHPHMVTIAPETGEKRHVILRFGRGDVMVAVGFRNHPPMILAAYFSARLVPDHHRPPERIGGGGSKARNGVPTTPGALLSRLEGLGAQIAIGDDDLGVVTYKGEQLGKIMLGRKASKASVETDWQRTQRRIAAKNKGT